jgi:D-sedoheptulose 7-phosphate isomerase
VDERLKEIADYAKVTAALQLRAAEECGPQIIEAADLIAVALLAGGKLLLCGNGGSAADCQHVAAEFTSTLSQERPRRALAAVALTTDTSLLTAYGNDYGFDGVFARQVEALGRAGDVLVGISTSGHSENVRRAIRAGRERSLRTIGIVGQRGPLREEVDVAIVIPSNDTQHVQEAMLPIEHLICQLAERSLIG